MRHSRQGEVTRNSILIHLTLIWNLSYWELWKFSSQFETTALLWPVCSGVSSVSQKHQSAELWLFFFPLRSTETAKVQQCGVNTYLPQLHVPPPALNEAQLTTPHFHCSSSQQETRWVYLSVGRCCSKVSFEHQLFMSISLCFNWMNLNGFVVLVSTLHLSV